MHEHAPAKCATASDSCRCLLPELSAEEVHKNILRCHSLKNRVHRRLLEWLYVLIVRDYAEDLGSSSPAEYVKANLGYEGSSEAYRVVEVARAVPALSRSLDAFDRGRLSWSQLKRIASVVRVDTEEAWLTYALSHKPWELKAEAEDAIRNGRRLPRKARRGLPNTIHNVVFRFSREEKEILRKALEKRAARLKLEKGEEGWRPSPEEVLNAFCLDELSAPDDLPSGFEGRPPVYMIVYQKCLDCRASHVFTKDGPVEVTEERIAEIEGEARKVTIEPEEMFVKGEAILPGKTEGDIPAGVEVKVLARHDHACAHCGRRLGLHLHHIVFRSRGGPHAMWNLAPACEGCHALIHQGVLEVFLDSLGELYWRTKADKVTALLAEEIEELASIPSAKVVLVREGTEQPVAAAPAATPPSEPAAIPSPAGDPVGSNGAAPSLPAPQAVAIPAEAEGAAEALEKLGYKAKEARKRVEAAVRILRGLGRAPTGNEILNIALRGKSFVSMELRVSADAETSSPRSIPGTGEAAGDTAKADEAGGGPGS